MAEILGIPVSQVPTPSGSASPAPVEETEQKPDEVKREATDLVSTSTMSVSDYFRQKLREKALARQAASGSTTPLPDLPPALEVKPSSDWEGSKVKFEEADVKLETLGGYELTAPDEQAIAAPEDERAAKKARKAEKAAKKAEKEALKVGVKLEPEDLDVTPESKETKAARKAAKQAKKQEKAEKKRKRED
jgi:Pin2-interacting protein X1